MSAATAGVRSGAVGELRVAGHGGLFVADEAVVDGPFVHASGRWRRRIGQNHSRISYSAPCSRSWPAAAVVEIRWTGTEAAA